MKTRQIWNCPAVRYGMIGFGCFNVGCGVIGVFIPGLPSTVFLLIAVWAFSKGSPRLQRWMLEHPRFGPLIQDWFAHRVIPAPAKALAITMMAVSLAVFAVFVSEGWVMLAVIGLCEVAAGAYILTRPSRVPQTIDSAAA